MHKNIFIIILFSLFLLGCNQHTEETFQADSEHEVSEQNIDISTDEKEGLKEEQKEEIETPQNEQAQLDQLTVHYIDVGQGDATLFEYTEDNQTYTILYDVGDWQGNEVVPYLQKEDIQFIDLIIISHPHADHIGQLEKVMKTFDVGEVWMSGNIANTNVFQDAMNAVLESETDYDEPAAGDTFDIGPLILTVLHPAELTNKLNEDSLSVRFTYGNISFLFTGDAYTNQERLMMQRTDHIQADFLQLGHHGSNTSSDPRFIEAVNPTYAIYSAGTDNSYGHPHEEIVNLLDSKNISLYGTDRHGTIIVTTDGIESKLITEKDGEIQLEKETESKPIKNVSKEEVKKKAKDCIDINHASKEELQEIIHIGDARADALIELRPFESIDNLNEINGIGPARLADIKSEGKACMKGGN